MAFGRWSDAGDRTEARERAAVECSSGEAGGPRGLIHERQSDSTDEDGPGVGKRIGQTKAMGLRRGEGRELGDVVGNASDADPANYDAVVEDWHAVGIYGVGVAIVELRFSSQDAGPGASGKRCGRIDGHAGKKICGERAAAVGVFDAVEIGGGRVGDAGREVNAADGTDRV